MLTNLLVKIYTNLDHKPLWGGIDDFDVPSKKHAHSFIVYDCLQAYVPPLRELYSLIKRLGDGKLRFVDVLFDLHFEIEVLHPLKNFVVVPVLALYPDGNRLLSLVFKSCFQIQLNPLQMKSYGRSTQVYYLQLVGRFYTSGLFETSYSETLGEILSGLAGTPHPCLLFLDHQGLVLPNPEDCVEDLANAVLAFPVELLNLL